MHRKSQESMSRATLDERKSSEKLSDYYELASESFYDEACAPKMVSMEGEHPKLSLLQKLLKRERLMMTAEKVKSKIGDVKLKLNYVIEKHERSGNGASQRSKDSPDWGNVDLSFCTYGDDRQNYLEITRMTGGYCVDGICF